ncbi:P-loop containing nucleoside triphosphate hydrolase protein [Dichotomopilus funicola]|uniref:DNA 3'-5' helicase n=1 Tax=Dichotomopilus funicola TaxID=1934379 RepID=A0AAN6V5P4_9PEZI|nr:P-loop containing nucleoside triphosphate hydrolase protein [Dichotomopilus funicola]
MPPPPRAPTTSKHAILKGLNDAQRRAVTSDSDTVAILAGPGSGKTHTLTARVVWLIDHKGIRPEDVIVATFTVKAAREMKDRISKVLGNNRETKLILGTFHSIARRYLAAYGRHIGLSQSFGIADSDDSNKIIGRICKRLQLAVDPSGARAWISKQKAKGTEATSKASRKEAGKVDGLQELETCYREYQKQLKASNLLDYDDLLVSCVELLQKFPACVSNVQAVLIDEYQDTNGIQYDLMKLFAQQRKRITTVGDPDQSIYGWRSAEIRNLWKLLREFPKTDEVSLEQNYRSSQAILDLSLEVIKQDQKRYKKVLKPTHNRGSRPVLRRLKSPSTEADWVVSEIRRALVMSGAMLTHDDVAILLRSAALSRHLESSLGKAGIPYRMIGGFKFYDREEIKVLINYLRVIHQPENNDALARIMNVPKRGIGEVTVKRLLEEAETSSLSLWSVLSKHCRGDRTAETKITKHAEQQISGNLLRPLREIQAKVQEGPGFGLVDTIQHLLTKLNFEEHLKRDHRDPEDAAQRWANVQEFLALAAEFARDLELSDEDALPEIDGLVQTKDAEVLPRFLANVSLASDAQTKGDGEESKPVVTISTIHAAKGLEWPVVFVPAVYDGSIPHVRSEDGDEERRLLYVAMTRAQSLLYLSFPVFGGKGDGERNKLSPFIDPVSRYFLNKGPCFDRPVMSEIAKVLRRQLPPDEDIYKGLPNTMTMEDNMFPVDPEATNAEIGPRAGLQGGDASRAKRQRLHGPPGNSEAGEEAPWKQYSTTMEKASTFTVKSLPGFVNLGAHQAAITAANAEVLAAQRVEKTKPPANKLPSNQKSIMGFVKTADGAPRTTAGQSAMPPPTNPQFLGNTTSNQPQGAPTSPAISPALAGHNLATGKVMARPSAAKEPETAKRKQYPCFSSSPPRETASNDASGNGENDAESDDDNGPPAEPARAAACLHATTWAVTTRLTAGIRRPQGLGRRNNAPNERLRQPFKPLTMGRPGGRP